MIRKTLTILSLIGLLLSGGLWGVSYWGIHYRHKPISVEAYRGSLTVAHQNLLDEVLHKMQLAQKSMHLDAEWDVLVLLQETQPEMSNGAFSQLRRLLKQQKELKEFKEEGTSLNKPRWLTGSASRQKLTLGAPKWSIAVPLWLPVLAFATPIAWQVISPVHRRRKRKKLGLCVKCGYDLRGSKERCPECGTEF